MTHNLLRRRMRSPLVYAVGTAAVLAMVATGCSSDGGSTTTPKSTDSPGSSELEKIAHYKGDDRQKMLEEGAKKEGSVQLYTSGILTSATGVIVEDFQKKYGITVEVVRASNDEIAARAIREAGAGQHLVDVYETTGVGIRALSDRGLLTTYDSPNLAQYDEDALTKGDGGTLATVVRESYHGIGWNTKLVAPADVPKDYEGLLNPNLKGKMAITESSDDMIGAFLEAKGEDFVNSLKSQKIALQNISSKQLSGMVASGEVALSPDLGSAHVAQLKEKGAPIEWEARLQPVVTNDGSVALSSKAPHPHAAMLLVDYFLSKDAADAYDKFGYGVPRTDIESANTLPPSIDRYYASRQADYEANLNKWHDIIIKITQ